jgi:hypothetical protein
MAMESEESLADSYFLNDFFLLHTVEDERIVLERLMGIA